MRQMTRKAYAALPQNHRTVIHGQPWAVVADDGVSFVPVELDEPLTASIEINGELWIVDYCATLGDIGPLTRGTIKAHGGTVYATLAQGNECNMQMWQDELGRFWYGSDWHNDSMAILYPAYYSPF